LTVANVGFLPNSDRPSAVELAKKTASWLEAMGHETAQVPDHVPPKTWGGSTTTAPEVDGLDLLVSLGGDGTMLRAVGMVLGSDVPVLGVNFGRFGYLTAIEPEGLRRAIERFLAGDYQIERRMTVDANILPVGTNTPRFSATALNDITISRPTGMHTINANVGIRGERFLSYAADAMIVSTATGSTGYNLSARGPIISPLLRCLVLTPVAAHMLFDRSLVLDSSDELSFELQGRCGADLIVDGLPCQEISLGERLFCRAGAHDAILVGFGGKSFENILKNKFHLTDR
jgi:NAD+ kinase